MMPKGKSWVAGGSTGAAVRVEFKVILPELRVEFKVILAEL